MQTLAFLPGELWWGGEVGSWDKMPIDESGEFSINFRLSQHNQTAPLFLSNKGRIIFSKEVFTAKFSAGTITLDGPGEISVLQGGETLRDAYRYASHRLYQFEQRELSPLYFTVPQYNTWVQMGYQQNEQGVLRYAEGLLANGYPPGILMIDEGWQKGYGTWEFNERFPNPKGMVDRLHEMGFKVMLWVVPYLSADCPLFRKLWFKPNDHLCRTFDDQPAIDHWWNGYSASFNLALEGDREILGGQLHALMRDYGIDGFKFDGGNIFSYRMKAINGPRDQRYMPEALNLAWNEFGYPFDFHEYKDTYNRMGKACIQRICDAHHHWIGNGIDKLIGSGLMQNLLGYPYNCPDMIGGGCISPTADNLLQYDSELFVRTAQLAAFFPVMQFSAAPYEVLDQKHSALVLKAAKLHMKLADTTLRLVKRAMETGEPIMQHMEYAFPGQGYERVTDQFMYGDELLVAPVIRQGETTKEVLLPAGKWKAPDGSVLEGGRQISYPAPLEVIPYFKKTV